MNSVKKNLVDNSLYNNNSRFSLFIVHNFFFFSFFFFFFGGGGGGKGAIVPKSIQSTDHLRILNAQ